MPRLVAILDDEPERLALMEEVLGAYADLTVLTFDNAPDMVEWARTSFATSLPTFISLDHDLGPNRERDGQVFDPGCGRDVVDALIATGSQCPVIVHTSNGRAGTSMVMDFEMAGWQVDRVHPVFGHQWIPTAWAEAVAAQLGESEPSP